MPSSTKGRFTSRSRIGQEIKDGKKIILDNTPLLGHFITILHVTENSYDGHASPRTIKTGCFSLSDNNKKFNAAHRTAFKKYCKILLESKLIEKRPDISNTEIGITKEGKKFLSDLSGCLKNPQFLIYVGLPDVNF